MTNTPDNDRHEREWQPVKGYHGKYEVSSDGLLRKACGVPVGQWPNGDGYMLARLSDPRKVVRVHRIVAEAFIPNPLSAPFINHKDCDRANNDSSNLEWCTQAENLAHMDSLGRRSKHWSGKRSPNASLSDDQVRDLRGLRNQHGLSLSKLAERFGISKRAVQRCIIGETYSCLPSPPEPHHFNQEGK